ncbi:MAG: hypothetical protein ACTMH4_07300 [Sphingobacterium sp.]
MGVTYGSIPGSGIDENMVTGKYSNGKEPLLSNIQQTLVFNLKDESSNSISLNSLKGKAVFINFWAT